MLSKGDVLLTGETGLLVSLGQSSSSNQRQRCAQIRRFLEPIRSEMWPHRSRNLLAQAMLQAKADFFPQVSHAPSAVPSAPPRVWLVQRTHNHRPDGRALNPSAATY